MAGIRRRDRLAVAAGLRTGVAALVVLAAAAACGTAASTSGASGAATSTGTSDAVTAASQEPAGTISETGSSLLYPLLADYWAPAFHAQFPSMTLKPAYTGSQTGIADASAGLVDIGASDAYLSSGDLVKNPTLLNIPLAISAQTVIYNLPSLPADKHVQLDGEVLAGIYNGTITTWDDKAIEKLNPGLALPPDPIVPVVRSDGSGDTFLFTSYLSTQDTTWNNAYGYGTTVKWPPVQREMAVKGSSKVLTTCENTVGCIAYNGISYLQGATSAGLGYAALDNFAGQPTTPTPTTIADAVASFVSITPPNETISMIDGPSTDGYPIVNFEYAIVSARQPDTAKASEIKAFLTWAITTGNGAQFLGHVEFEPLPPAVADLAKAQIAEIGS